MRALLNRFFSNRAGRPEIAAAPPAALPEGLRVYAIGDIHGRADLLEVLTAMIVADRCSAPGPSRLIYLGDYVDRGPGSRQVIDSILAGPGDFQRTFLRGNHDQVLLDFLDDPLVFRRWRDFGIRETLMSYGVLPPRFDDESAFAETRDRLVEVMPRSHREFLAGTELSLRLGDYFFAHAGVRPGMPLDRQTPSDLMWARDEFLGSRADFGAVVVHGHTPVERPKRAPNRISVDTGAYATGCLTAVVLEGTDCRFLHT